MTNNGSFANKFQVNAERKSNRIFVFFISKIETVSDRDAEDTHHSVASQLNRDYMSERPSIFNEDCPLRVEKAQQQELSKQTKCVHQNPAEDPSKRVFANLEHDQWNDVFVTSGAEDG